jgi:hypothetical protein
VSDCQKCGLPGRPYMTGHWCDDHTPAKQAGRVDHIPDPERTLDALRAAAGHRFSYIRNDTSLKDERARRLGQAVSKERRKLWREAESGSPSD